jgi:hypothetical protein
MAFRFSEHEKPSSHVLDSMHELLDSRFVELNCPYIEQLCSVIREISAPSRNITLISFLLIIYRFASIEHPKQQCWWVDHAGDSKDCPSLRLHLVGTALEC